VAGKHLRCGNSLFGVSRIGSSEVSLITRKEKELAFNQRSTQCSTDLVTSVRSPFKVEKYSCALNLSLRMNSKTSPWNAFVPDLVTAPTCAPESTPLDAFCAPVCTLNSCSESGNGTG